MFHGWTSCYYISSLCQFINAYSQFNLEKIPRILHSFLRFPTISIVFGACLEISFRIKIFLKSKKLPIYFLKIKNWNFYRNHHHSIFIFKILGFLKFGVGNEDFLNIFALFLKPFMVNLNANFWKCTHFHALPDCKILSRPLKNGVPKHLVGHLNQKIPHKLLKIKILIFIKWRIYLLISFLFCYDKCNRWNLSLTNSGVQFQNLVCHFMRNGGEPLSPQFRSDILCFEIAR